MKHEGFNDSEPATYMGHPAKSWGELYGFEAIKDYPYEPENKLHWAGKDKQGKDVLIDTPTLLRAYLRTSIVAEASEEFVEDVVVHGTRYVEEFFNKPTKETDGQEGQI